MSPCPATGEPHTYEDYEDEQGAGVKCTECSAGERFVRAHRRSRLWSPTDAAPFALPDEWSMR